jgi:hypothetical protein
MTQVCPCTTCVVLYSCRCYHHAFIDPVAVDFYTDHKDELETALKKHIDFEAILTHSTVTHYYPLVATEWCRTPTLLISCRMKTTIAKELILKICFRLSLNCNSKS